MTVDNIAKKARVVAVVAPGSLNNGRYDFSFSTWIPFDNMSILRFACEFECNTDDYELLKSIEELQRVILALFLCDSVPRKIYFFEYGEGLSENDTLKFRRVFGPSRTPFETEQLISIKSFDRLGFFNQMPLLKIDFVASENVIKSWFEFLSQNSHISSSLQLIQESFGLAHELFVGHRIIDFTELSTVLLLLVSGLESLFTHGDDSHADISFKFRTVGAAYYSKYVDVTSLKTSNPLIKGKFSYTDFKNILRILYDLRSSIAHGNFNLTFFSDKKIRKLMDDLFFSVGVVGEVNQDMKSIYFGQLLGVLGMLDNHILEIFRSARTNLNKGVNILDEILDENTSSEKQSGNA